VHGNSFAVLQLRQNVDEPKQAIAKPTVRLRPLEQNAAQPSMQALPPSGAGGKQGMPYLPYPGLEVVSRYRDFALSGLLRGAGKACPHSVGRLKYSTPRLLAYSTSACGGIGVPLADRCARGASRRSAA
jgi:hypothetical protein